MDISYNFCPNCGQPLLRRRVAGHVRPTCDSCRFVHYDDPKVAVSVLVTRESQVLLVKRAVVPQIGYWALPAGFVDGHELPGQTAVREVLEETGLIVSLLGLMDIQPIANPDKRGFLMMYRGLPQGGALRPGDDVSEARWFKAEEIPWQDLAFDTTRQILRRWLDERAQDISVDASSLRMV